MKALRAAAALTLTVGLYGFPVVLALLSALMEPRVEYGTVEGSERAPVYVDLAIERPGEDDATAEGEDGDPTDAEVADVDVQPQAAVDDDAVADAAAIETDLVTLGESRVNTRAQRLAAAKKRLARARASRARSPEPKGGQTAKKKREPRKECSDLGDRILQMDDNEYVLHRELVRCYATHVQQFDAMGYGVWHEDDDGKRDGVRVRISRSSRNEDARLARRAGMRNNDVIHKINGQKLKSWGQIGMAYTQLYTRKNLRLFITRDGEPMVIHYRMVGDRGFEKARDELRSRKRLTRR